MPTIKCPTCSASVFAVVRDHAIEIKGGADIQGCIHLSAEENKQTQINDILQCGEMEAAVDKAVESLTQLPTRVIWPGDGSGKRHYERWEPLSGTLVRQNDAFRCLVMDISPGGAAVWTPSAAGLAEGMEISFELDGYGAIPAEVARLHGENLGLMFLSQREGERELLEWLKLKRQALNESSSPTQL